MEIDEEKIQMRLDKLAARRKELRLKISAARTKIRAATDLEILKIVRSWSPAGDENLLKSLKAILSSEKEMLEKTKSLKEKPIPKAKGENHES